ncbi:MAG TPA: NUDIX domain-containing protein [Methanomicrobia archaeon]|nr:NUDIX domain-containing protein [Methanomicrobia archaeon]HEX59671.1 NUDIX domain-containing protein [Methanomicrobia archaeon]
MQIMVAVGAVIKDRSGRILLVRHVPEHKSFWSGKWICPGGRLEFGESIEEGILREVAEETHLRIKLIRPLVPFERIVKEDGETKLHVIYIDYLAEVVGGELKPDDDVGEAIWASKEEILRRWDELHEDTKKLLKIAGVID